MTISRIIWTRKCLTKNKSDNLFDFCCQDIRYQNANRIALRSIFRSKILVNTPNKFIAIEHSISKHIVNFVDEGSRKKEIYFYKDEEPGISRES